ncbi:MAG: hypothetical protein ABI683_06370 [Ginsengibacter sp.]
MSIPTAGFTAERELENLYILKTEWSIQRNAPELGGGEVSVILVFSIDDDTNAVFPCR